MQVSGRVMEHKTRATRSGTWEPDAAECMKYLQKPLALFSSPPHYVCRLRRAAIGITHGRAAVPRVCIYLAIVAARKEEHKLAGFWIYREAASAWWPRTCIGRAEYHISMASRSSMSCYWGPPGGEFTLNPSPTLKLEASPK